MTKEQAEALGLRAVAADWEFWAGQAVRSDGRLYYLVRFNGGWIAADPVDERLVDLGKPWKWGEDVWPDFRCPSSVGAAMECVRHTWGHDCICVVCADPHATEGEPVWAVQLGEQCLAEGESEAEALVAALEAAP